MFIVVSFLQAEKKLESLSRQTAFKCFVTASNFKMEMLAILITMLHGAAIVKKKTVAIVLRFPLFLSFSLQTAPDT